MLTSGNILDGNYLEYHLQLNEREDIAPLIEIEALTTEPSLLDMKTIDPIVRVLVCTKTKKNPFFC